MMSSSLTYLRTCSKLTIVLTAAYQYLSSFRGAFNVAILFIFFPIYAWNATLNIIPQAHKDRFVKTDKSGQGIEISEEEFVALNTTALTSQHKIALFLASKPNAVVFVEGLTHNFDGSTQKFAAFEHIRTAFKNGIPKAEDSLTGEQKKILLLDGAPLVVHALGLITGLRRVVSPSDNERIRIQVRAYKEAGSKYGFRFKDLLEISPGFRDLVNVQREKLALTEIHEYLDSEEYSEDAELYLVFGAAHDFVPWQANFPELTFQVVRPETKSSACEFLLQMESGRRVTEVRR